MSRKFTQFLSQSYKGILLCLAIAIPADLLGQKFALIGGPVFAILLGMIITLFIKDKSSFEPGIKYTSKKILQYAVILLGFGLNLNVIFETGKQSLPIIIATISTSLLLAFVLSKLMHIPYKISTLVGVGSSICGGSAVAATAPVIDADDEEVNFSIKQIFPFFILYFIAASIITTIALNLGANPEIFSYIKDISKFFIVWAMAAIGLNTNIVKLIKTGGKPIIMGFVCWTGITLVSLFMQYMLHLW